MKVRNFKFFWEYHYDAPREVTVCYAQEANSDSLELHGVVRRFHKDPHDKEVAKKRSLSTLLLSRKDLFPKDFRKEIWDAYRTLTKVPKWGASSELTKEEATKLEQIVEFIEEKKSEEVEQKEV